MKSRMKNPALVVPDAMPALVALGTAAKKGGVPTATLDLVYLRVSQINGCSVCVDMHAKDLMKIGLSNAKIIGVSAWRESPHFTEAERAALALAEATTRISDREDPVPDAIWEEVCRHYDEAARATLVLNVALINFWNRLNAATKQVVGAM